MPALLLVLGIQLLRQIGPAHMGLIWWRRQTLNKSLCILWCKLNSVIDVGHLFLWSKTTWKRWHFIWDWKGEELAMQRGEENDRLRKHHEWRPWGRNGVFQEQKGQKNRSTVERRDSGMRWEQRPALKTLYIMVKNSAFVTLNRKLWETIPFSYYNK